jgi:hypothetical protein
MRESERAENLQNTAHHLPLQVGAGGLRLSELDLEPLHLPVPLDQERLARLSSRVNARQGRWCSKAYLRKLEILLGRFQLGTQRFVRLCVGCEGSLKSFYLFNVCLFLFSRRLYKPKFSLPIHICKATADNTHSKIFSQSSKCYSECRVCSPELVFIRDMNWEL